MKFLRLIAILISIIACLPALAQDIVNDEKTILRTTYYDLELFPTGKMLDGDSLYRVILVVDSEKARKFTSISIESKLRTKQLDVAILMSAAEAKVRTGDSPLRLDMTEWADLSEAYVIGTKPDGSKEVLRPSPDPNAVVHDVKTLWSQTRDIEIITNEKIPEEELEEVKEATNLRKDN